MKTKIPFLFFLISLISFGQTPINTYYSIEDSVFAVVTSSTPIDQTASGGSLIWNFTSLSTDGTTNIDNYTVPTSGELISYPGTTSVLTITDNVLGTSKILTRNVSNTVSLTGAESTDLELNYSNNALIGTFPMNYGVSNSDATAGDFTYTTYSGTFTGTISTEADAYGTLNMNDLGEGTFSGNVTRLKTVQNLSLTYGIPNVGTVVQTTYNYYDSSNGNLVFRTNTVTVVVSLLGINQTTTIMESLLPLSTLSINENEMDSSELSIVPNPVGDVLNIRLNQNETIRSIAFTDISGRQVMIVNDNLTSVSVTNLKVGLYIASITTDKGVYIKKFLKK